MTRKVHLKSGNISDLKKIFTFYQNDFIEEERKSLNHLKNLMDNSHYKLILGFDEDKLIGYSFVCDNKHDKKVWLDYIAIIEGNRGKNYGSIFLKKLMDNFKNNFDGMFFEIEKPDSSNPDYVFQLKRLKFYSQFELEKLELNYKIPTEDGGFPIDLYYKPFSKNEKSITYKEIMEAVLFVFNTIHFDISSREKIFHQIFKGLIMD